MGECISHELKRTERIYSMKSEREMCEIECHKNDCRE
jgi:hypothetical protein